MRSLSLLLALVILSALAFAWPGLFGSAAFDPFLASRSGLWGLIALAMFVFRRITRKKLEAMDRYGRSGDA